MAVGKNKRLSKGGKRTQKRKVGDTMLGKEWYDVVAPEVFKTRHCGKTICNKSKGTALASDSLKGRVFEVCLADLMGDEKGESDDKVYKARNIRLKAEDVQGRNVLTQFFGMSMTTDSLRSLFKKWVTLIEGMFECKTSDGYTLRVFSIAFTTKVHPDLQSNAHCQSSHVKKIRQKMGEIITKFVTKNVLQQVVKGLQNEIMGEDIRKACAGIYKITDVNIRKVKVVKTPKTDLGRLLESHGGQEGIPKSVEGGRQKMAAVVEEAETGDAEEADE